jgi:hypothetical protein
MNARLSREIIHPRPSGLVRLAQEFLDRTGASAPVCKANDILKVTAPVKLLQTPTFAVFVRT